MAVGIITTPSTWASGTVATPAWFQNAQDSLNAIQGVAFGGSDAASKYHLWSEDFDGANANATADGALFGKMVTNSTVGMTYSNVLNTTADTGTNGIIRLTSTSGASSVAQLYASNLGLTSSADFKITIRFKTITKASIGSFGCRIGAYIFAATSGYGIRIYNTGALGIFLDNIEYSPNLFTSANDGTWYLCELTRTSGTYIFKVDGVTQVLVAGPGVLTPITTGTVMPQIYCDASANNQLISVDYLKILSARA